MFLLFYREMTLLVNKRLFPFVRHVWMNGAASVPGKIKARWPKTLAGYKHRNGYFTVFSTVENRMCKRDNRATFFIHATTFIQLSRAKIGLVRWIGINFNKNELPKWKHM